MMLQDSTATDKKQTSDEVLVGLAKKLLPKKATVKKMVKAG
jgi:hypothetical protein